MRRFRIGDRVVHSEHGEGVVKAVYSVFCEVEFLTGLTEVRFTSLSEVL